MIRVLVVDDEVDLARNIAAYLRSYPGEFEVALAFTGEEGEAAVAAETFDVLLTDVRLPGIDGIELIRRSLERRPQLKVIVMTAFGSSRVRSLALTEGAITFLEKPLDLEELRGLIVEVAGETSPGWAGSVGGLDIFDLAQLLALSNKTRVLKVTCGGERGMLLFRDGKIVHASCGSLEGEDAFFAMAVWAGGTFEEVARRDAGRLTKNVSVSTTHLMMEAARLRDEARSVPDDNEPGATGADSSGAPASPAPREREDTVAIKEHLSEFQGIEGFLGAAVFSAQGEMLEGITSGKLDVKAVGMFANNALLNAQKATDQMGVGRGNLMQIRAPQATVMMRCLNEATDFAATAQGKAHFHTVVVMAPEGNSGMATMILDKVVGKIAEEIR